MKSLDDRIALVISEQFGISRQQVVPTANMRADFGMDSLDDIELMMALEDEFGLVIADEDAEKWVTPADVVAYITRVVPA